MSSHQNAPTRREVMSGMASAFGVVSSLRSANAQRSGTPVNVLYICVDDLNHALSVYKNSVARTPNIERLARRGVTFDNAYCQYPLCQPSRTSFLSGKRPETTRVWTLDTPTREFIGDSVLLPELFRKHGYFTAHAGKIFHTGEKCEDRRSWDKELRDYGKTPPKDQVLQASNDHGPKGHTFEWDILKTPDSEMPDGVYARTTVETLDKVARERTPFFLGCGFRRPHAPYAAPAKYYDLFSAERMPLPNTTPDDFKRVLPAAVNHLPPDKPLTDTEVRQHLRAYYASVSFVDAQLGLVLDAMDRLNLWDTTAVIFHADHGYLLGEHGGMWHKNSLFEPAASVPLVVHVPGMKAAGRHSTRLVELVDMYPTLAEVCGLTPPSDLEGISIRPLLDEPARGWKKAAFTMQGRDKDRTEAAKVIEFTGKTIRTERYRYTEWDGGKQGYELYDEQQDPRENNNLAGNRKHAQIESELRERLRAGWREARPS